jgi:hypothetical protein
MQQIFFRDLFNTRCFYFFQLIMKALGKERRGRVLAVFGLTQPTLIHDLRPQSKQANHYTTTVAKNNMCISVFSYLSFIVTCTGQTYKKKADIMSSNASCTRHYMAENLLIWH